MKKLYLIILFFAINIYALDNRSAQLKYITKSWDTNWNNSSIDFTDIKAGGPPRDGIPAINNAKFVTIVNAKSWLKDNEPVIFVKINNKTKAYPIQILMWHEIVNDSLDNIPLAVTFCPLCNSSVVFNRKINNTIYDFGTSGLLLNSNLIMYDRQTQSLWQQFTAQSIVGDMNGKKLNQLASSIRSFKDVYTNFPNTKILSRDTGYKRAYGNNPYIGYDDINQSPFMISKKIDNRLAPMRRVATIGVKDKYIAYPYNVIRKVKVLNDTFENKDLVLFYNDNISSALDKSNISKSKNVGSVVVYSPIIDNITLNFYYKNGYFYDKQTNSKWNIYGESIKGKYKSKQLKAIIHGSDFWFAWVVFRPDTLIYTKKKL